MKLLIRDCKDSCVFYNTGDHWCNQVNKKGSVCYSTKVTFLDLNSPWTVICRTIYSKFLIEKYLI